MSLISVGKRITQLARTRPDGPAVTCHDKTVTWRELDVRTNRLARAYRHLGVKANDLVTVGLPNSIAFVEACCALWKLGAIPQPVSHRLPKKELAAIVELVNPPLVIGFSKDVLPEHQVLSAAYNPDPALSDEILPDITPPHSHACTSGGSTGHPKIIVSGYPGALDPEMPSPVKQLPDRTHVVPGPLYHNGPFGSAMSGLLLGNHIVLMTRFDAEETLRLIEQYRVDWMFVVPTMMHRIWRLGIETRDRYDISSLRMVYHSAAPCPVWLKEAWINWLGPEKILEAYGGTEGIGSTYITGEEWLRHKGSVGKPRTDCRLRILNDAGKDLPPGQVGEIYFLPDSGQGSTYHYIGVEAKTIEGGWETLGDMGYVDEDGYLYLADRKKDLIICGGANIYPAEVEAAIDSHPKVRSSIVIGLPDEDLGQKVHAIVDAPDGITEKELLAYLAEQIVRYKIPRSVELVDYPLRDEAGKARRSALVEERSASVF